MSALIVVIVVIVLAMAMRAAIRGESYWSFPGDSSFRSWDRMLGGRVERKSLNADDFKLRPLTPEKLNAGDYIENLDPYLERLIEDGKLNQAQKYVGDMEKLAIEVRDEKALRTYTIYEARIEARKQELDKVMTESMRQYKALIGQEHAKKQQVSLSESLAKPAFEEPVARPPEVSTSAPKQPEADDEKTEQGKTIDPDEYTDLISL